MSKASAKGSTLPVSSAPAETAGVSSGPPSQAALIESFLTGAAEGEPGTEADTPPPQGGDESGNATESPVLSQTEHEPPGEPPGGEQESAVEGEEPPAPKGKQGIEFTPEQQEVFNHRLGKEVSKRKAAEQELQELQAELETARAGKPKAASQPEPSAAAPDSDPVETAPEVVKARTEANQHRQIASGAKALLKRVVHEPEAVAEQLKEMGINLPSTEPEAIAEWLDEAREGALTKAHRAEAKAEFIAERTRGQQQAQMQQFDAHAIELYPWHRDKESDQFKRAAAIVQHEPWLLKRPDRLIVLGDLVEGQMAREAKTKNGKPAAPAKPKSGPPPRLGSPSYESPAAVRPASRVEFPKDTTNAESRSRFIAGMLD